MSKGKKNQVSKTSKSASKKNQVSKTSKSASKKTQNQTSKSSYIKKQNQTSNATRSADTSELDDPSGKEPNNEEQKDEEQTQTKNHELVDISKVLQNCKFIDGEDTEKCAVAFCLQQTRKEFPKENIDLKPILEQLSDNKEKGLQFLLLKTQGQRAFHNGVQHLSWITDAQNLIKEFFTSDNENDEDNEDHEDTQNSELSGNDLIASIVNSIQKDSENLQKLKELIKNKPAREETFQLLVLLHCCKYLFHINEIYLEYKCKKTNERDGYIDVLIVDKCNTFHKIELKYYIEYATNLFSYVSFDAKLPENKDPNTRRAYIVKEAFAQAKNYNIGNNAKNIALVFFADMQCPLVYEMKTNQNVNTIKKNIQTNK